MDFLANLFQSTRIDELGVLLLVIFLALFIYFIYRAQVDTTLALRPIAAYDALKQLLARAAEEGRSVHISVGTAGVYQATTADTTAGLYTLDFLADRAAVSAAPPSVTVSDPSALPVVQDVLRRSYERQGYPEEYDARLARLIAPNVPATPAAAVAGAPGSAVAYAAGVMDLLNHERVIANVMVGAFGDEFLLIAEPGAQRNLLQAGGTSNPQVLPFVFTSVSHPLFGEEIYAAGAYLNARRTHIGSLLAQDMMRGILVLIVVLGIVLRLAGLF